MSTVSYLNRSTLKNRLPNEIREIAKTVESLLAEVKKLREQGVMTEDQYQCWYWWVRRTIEEVA